MKLLIEDQIFNEFPEVKLGIVFGFDINNSAKSSEIGKLSEKWQQEQAKKFLNIELSSYEKIVPWREAYLKFGAKPSKYNSSIESLLKRVKVGGKLPNINNLVDLYNTMSLKFELPFGAEDLDKVKGDIRLAFAKGNEPGKYIGSEKVDTCEKGEVAYLDELGFICRRWNWREADRTKITEETRNFVLVAEALSPTSGEELSKTIDEFINLSKKYLRGSYKTGILDKDKPVFEIDFKTGSEITDEDVKMLQINKKGKVFPTEASSAKQKQEKVYTGNSKIIADAINKVLGVSNANVEFAENEAFGDYSTNIAMILVKKEGKNPHELAKEIVKKINRMDLPAYAEAKAGFINFWLKEDVLVDNLIQIDEEKGNYGESRLLDGKKIMFEYAHPNTHKAFHIGHLRNITTGETLARLHGALGAEVIRVNYQGDIGLHIAKALWGIKKIGFVDPLDIRKRAEFLGKAYAAGAAAYEEDKVAKEEIHTINAKIYDKSDKELNKLYQETRKWSLDYLGEIYKRVYTKFDRLYFESEVAENGKEIALGALKNGILEKSEGAVIFPGSKYGLHDRVFISGKGVPTYEAKDLGLAKIQFSEYNPDKLIHTVGPEQIGYFQVIIKALELIMPATKGKEVHVPYGWVRLKEGKMSSRTGNVILGEDILDQAKEDILKNHKVDSETAEKIAVGAVKYSFLKCSTSQDIAFDLKESISLEGNSGPYLQYTVARINSVLAKGKRVKELKSVSINCEEELILRTLTRFPEIIADAAFNYSPNTLCSYLYGLAQKFNSFYNKHRIIGSKNYELRIMLTAGVGQVLKTGLKLLGIEAPERM